MPNLSGCGYDVMAAKARERGDENGALKYEVLACDERYKYLMGITSGLLLFIAIAFCILAFS